MTRSVTYSCDILQGINKGGTHKRDADGWFLDVVLGALNVENSAGDFYPLDYARAQFEQSTALMRKAAKGVLFGEAGHPEFKKGMTRDDFINRLRQFPHDNVSHAIRNLRLQECVNPQSGVRYVAILGDVLPVRKQGEYLLKELLTKDINVCFSIRSLTRDVPRPDGTYTKYITQLLSVDWVNEGGIIHAQQYNSPALESFKERFKFTKEEAELALASVSNTGMESKNSIDISSAFAYDIKASKPQGIIVPGAGW